MIERFEARDAHDPRLALAGPPSTSLLARFNLAGVLTSADVHVARRACVLTGLDPDGADDPGARVALAVALAVRAVRHGSVCVDLAGLATEDAEPAASDAVSGGAELPPWPDAAAWLAEVAASPLAEAGVVRLEHDLLYLDRYWREEGQVRDDLLARAAASPEVDAVALQAHAERLFPAGFEEQRAAALRAAGSWTSVLTGGPGTGKTTAVAGLLALLGAQAAREGRALRIALTAPTGKAAARLQESVVAAQRGAGFDDDDRARLAGLQAATLHRLLGWRPESRTRFRHHRANRLPHDVVVVDETSMVSLTMMARLVEAVRPDARLVLVGDPDQLASVEAGAVLADVVVGLEQRVPGSVTALRRGHRYGPTIGRLAEALRTGDADTALALLASGGSEDPGDPGDPAWERLVLLDPDDPAHRARLRAALVDHASALVEAAERGDADAALAILERHRLLCAHRDGPYGVTHWNLQVERWLAEHLGRGVGRAGGAAWYPGRPLLVTANDYGLGLFNGDTGVVVRDGDRSLAVLGSPEQPDPLRLATGRLGEVDTMHAMTVHKSQGSQADAVTVLLPPPDSPLLTRELLYTAVTRARRRVTIVGDPASVRAALERRAQRASGLARRFGT
ncbi:exodeoxyribonuclease V subunit alpha [Nocardioides sp. TRM66260-LWL]|uniref:exodeoxyribonuclease V subunit alpha n=1 Tax=Nocardioides sp. TRM66260-LWL TaxID=2874478 RepID=UPI001CC36BEC|nr:exodeoxyribonuclease V subunit alpha [Nocardioides sp. TRM66260-LWL]MBZ5735768.1 exodeoxyribonuclease V subunit alpha [Nocardioides sp. TRM66260-LWL]